MAVKNSTVKLVLGGDEIDIPKVLTEDKDIFHEVMSVESLGQALTAEEKEKLLPLLPNNTSLGFEQGLKTALSSDSVRFGVSPMNLVWEKLSRGSLSVETHHIQEEMKSLAGRHYKLGQAHYFVKLLQELVVSRQEVLQRALFAGSLENMWKGGGGQRKRNQLEEEEDRVCQIKRRPSGDDQYRKILHELGCVDEGEDGSMSSSQVSEMDTISETEYRRLLRKHRKHRKEHQVSYLSVMERLSEKSASTAPTMPQVKKLHHHHHRHHHHHHHHRHHHHRQYPPEDEQWVTPTHHSTSSRKSSKMEPEVSTSRKEVGGTTKRGRKMMQERCRHERTTAAQARTIYKVYSPIDNGTVPEAQLEPIVLDQPLPTSKYKSFFSLLKTVFDPLNDKKAELAKVAKNLSHLIRSGDCSDCQWLELRSDWVELSLSALCYLAAEVGAYSSFSPLPHFVPLIEFRDRIDHWRWIGGGRDSELEMYVLFKHWLENLDKALPVVDYSDYEPLPPHVWANSGFVKSSSEELIQFRKMERERYASPHKAYIYNIRGYESPVGPVKGAKVYKKESGSKARGHALLVPNRPTCVTILSLVRDATSRLANGEGTRLDLCIQVQDSQYIADSVSETQLNNAVSGALDRLHYEKDPCVRYDGTRKVWIYLHRGRNEEDFERIHWACEVAAKQRKMLMARPKQRPEIILRVDGCDKVLDIGTAGGGEEVLKVGRKTTGRSAPTAAPTAASAGAGVSLSSSSSSSLVGLSGSSVSTESLAQGMATPTTPHSLPQPAQLSMVVASAVQGGSSILTEEDVGLGDYGSSLKVSLQAKRAKVASKVQESLDNQKSSVRKRKQSLKVAELLQDGTQIQSSHSSSSMSSGWSSDSEEPAPSPRLHPPELILDTSMGSTSEVKKAEDDWASSEGVSPDTSFDDY